MFKHLARAQSPGGIFNDVGGRGLAGCCVSEALPTEGLRASRDRLL